RCAVDWRGRRGDVADLPKGIRSAVRVPRGERRTKIADEFDPDEYLAFKVAENRRSAIWFGGGLALLPPAFAGPAATSPGWSSSAVRWGPSGLACGRFRCIL